MNANEYVRKVSGGVESDELAELIEGGKMNRKLERLDSHWGEVMRLAEKYGFISYAYGGAAVITTNKTYLESNNPRDLASRLRMNDVNL